MKKEFEKRGLSHLMEIHSGADLNINSKQVPGGSLADHLYWKGDPENENCFRVISEGFINDYDDSIKDAGYPVDVVSVDDDIYLARALMRIRFDVDNFMSFSIGRIFLLTESHPDLFSGFGSCYFPMRGKSDEVFFARVSMVNGQLLLNKKSLVCPIKIDQKSESKIFRFR